MSRLFVWSLTSALAGFLFGFDTVMISPAEQTKGVPLEKMHRKLGIASCVIM